MKKRILSLLLALVTVFYILPIGVVPAIALDSTDEETGLSVSDMEVGKLYSAKWVSDTFWPYARFNFINTYDALGEVINEELLPESVTVIRNSVRDFNLVYTTNLDWPAGYDDYRYIDADKLLIDGGLSVDEMELGKEYTAVWNLGEAETGLAPYRPAEPSESAIFEEYGYGDEDVEPEVSTKNFPEEVIVKKIYEDDTYVYATNVDWPMIYDQYRYIDPYYDLIITEEYVSPVSLTYRGEEVTEITLYEDGKMPLKAVKPEGLKDDVEWTWEVLVDSANNTWARIGDKTTDVCDVTYALVVNVLDENGQAKIRTVVDDGTNQYKSEPVTVKTKYIPKPMEPEYENVTAANDEYTVHSAKAYAAGDSTETITITVKFVKVRPDGTLVEGANNDFRRLPLDYDEYTVPLPAILGYYTLGEVGTIVNDIYPTPNDNPVAPTPGNEVTTVTIPAGATADMVYVVYYYPGEANYTVVHHQQNIYDDQYVEFLTETKTYTVDAQIPDVHYTATTHSSFVGFHHIYYEHAEVASDGSTVINVYYDRDYFDVIFVLVHGHAYGQDSLLVKYQTEIGVNIPKCTGFGFNGWEEVKEIKDANGNVTGYEEIPANQTQEQYRAFTASPQTVKPIITSSVNFRAIWVGETVNYAIVYWLENADNGAYSIWHTQTTVDDTESGARLTATAGQYVYWDGVILDSVQAMPEYKYASLNTSKSESEWTQFYDGNGVSRMGVVVSGDGKTTINIYFNRRTYNINFELSKQGNSTHSHEGENCEYAPIYCTHIHSGLCVNQGQEHDSTCVPTCGLDVHMHESSSECCNTHVHGIGCYETEYKKIDGTTATTPQNEDLTTSIQNMMREQVKADFTFIGGLVDSLFGGTITDTATTQANNILTMAYPKNLQNGFVYVTKSGDVTFDYLYKEVTHNFDIVAIYIEGEWYHYRADLTGVKLESAQTTINKSDGTTETIDYQYFITDTTKCDLPDHDHTSGCTYLVCTNTADDHVHEGSCNKCGYIEHVHNDLCYTGCGAAEGCGQHHHTADCYGNVCSIPTYDSTSGVTTIQLQAKYGQDITELLPYYLELYELGLHQNASGHNFVGWKYAGTGWADTGETRYVKHVTMVDELCYSEGVTATAVYNEAATNAYILYYLFESLNQIIDEDAEGYVGSAEYDISGNARQLFNDKWYDADPKHVQLVMWPTAGSTVDGGEKEIEGMTNVGFATGTLSLAVGAITSETLNAYFYDRNTTTVLIHNEDQIITIGGVKYGSSLSELKTLLNTEAYGKLDVDNIAYPDSLEAGGYEFAGWYSTNYINEHTRIDWDTSTVPNAELNLYALWKPVLRLVEVYEDSTCTTKFATDGTQYVDHRGFANPPPYSETTLYQGFEFGGWFYIDPDTGEEKAFRFSFAITEDIDIYAKWTSSIVVPYRINYLTPKLDSEGNEIEGEYIQIADSIYRTDIAGQSRTFFALTGKDLYSEYQKYYFPEVGSHTIQMVANNIAGEGETPVYEVNEYSFIYKRVASLKYQVNYVDISTGNPVADSVVKSTEDAAVTEIFKPIDGYTVDKYAKLLVLSIPESPDDEIGNNEITFYYTENEDDVMTTAPWIVYHYIQNLDGTYSVYSSTSGQGEFNESTPCYVIGSPLDKFAGYTFNPDKTDVTTRSESSPDTPFDTTDGLTSSVVDGKTQYSFQLNAYGVEINLYYDRDKVGYTVEYRDDRNNVLTVDGAQAKYQIDASESAYVHGEYAEVTLNDQWYVKLVVQGYQLADLSTNIRTKQLYIDESQNVIVFYFQKVDTEFNYVIKCDDLDSGVELTWTRDTIAANGLDEEGNPTTPVGSMPIESETYYFAGWFKDEECTEAVDPENDPVTITTDLENGEYNHLVPTKTAYDYYGVSGELYFSATYYALFLPRSADLEIKITSGQSDSFILTFTGVAGTFAEGKTFTVAVVDGVALTVTDVVIGQYTVTFDKKWSWRYGNLDSVITTVDVEVSVGGSITIKKDDLTIATDQWLTDNEVGMVTP